jgi:hypothetical protein
MIADEKCGIVDGYEGTPADDEGDTCPGYLSELCQQVKDEDGREPGDDQGKR